MNETWTTSLVEDRGGGEEGGGEDDGGVPVGVAGGPGENFTNGGAGDAESDEFWEDTVSWWGGASRTRFDS